MENNDETKVFKFPKENSAITITQSYLIEKMTDIEIEIIKDLKKMNCIQPEFELLFYLIFNAYSSKLLHKLFDSESEE